MNLQNLPIEIVQLVAKQGGQEIENLKYSNRYFYKLFLDSHMKKEINYKKIPKFPFEEWGTQLFFIECFRNRKFGRLVSFFNEEDLNLCKHTMLYLCIRFMHRTDLDNLLSKIKFSFIKLMRFESTIENRKDKYILKYIERKYPNLLCYVDDDWSDIPKIIDEECTIDQLHNNLIQQLNRKMNEPENLNSDSTIEDYEDLQSIEKDLLVLYKQRFLNFLTKEQENCYIMLDKDVRLLVVFFLINGNSLKDVFNLEEIKIVNYVIKDLYFKDIFLILKYCSVEAIKDLFQTSPFLTEFNLDNYVKNDITTFESDKINLVVERMATFSDKGFFNVLYLLNDSIGLIYSYYYYDVEVLITRIEKFISCISFKMVKRILSLELIEPSKYIGEIAYTYYLLIRYVKENKNIKQESEDISSMLNKRIKEALDSELYELVQYIYSISSLNFTILYSYCTDEEKSTEVISMLQYIKTNTKSISIVNKSKILMEKIQDKYINVAIY